MRDFPSHLAALLLRVETEEASVFELKLNFQQEEQWVRPLEGPEMCGLLVFVPHLNTDSFLAL